MRGKKLTELVYELISKDWPVHPTKVCRMLELEPTPSNISKVKYHFDKLSRDERIITKKLDRALVAWPTDIERLRIMRELFD